MEYNLAASGYWRNWERFYLYPMREINFTNIIGNPNIKQNTKPHSVTTFYPLSIDEKEEVKAEPPTAEEIEELKQRAKTMFK